MATSSTYTISESEVAPIYKLRKKIMKENVAVSHLTNLNPYIFCVDLSLELMELSYQTYYDPENYQTISSFGSLNLEKLDYILLPGYSFHDKEHETICYVFKHKNEAKIVVSFRGTSSKQHWNDNLNYKQLHVDFYGMALSDLDLVDGLDPSTLDIEDDAGRESLVEPERKSETFRGSSVIFRNISQRRLHVEAVQDDESESDEDEDDLQGIERDVRYALNLAGHV